MFGLLDAVLRESGPRQAHAWLQTLVSDAAFVFDWGYGLD